MLPRAEAVVVTTPQLLAQEVASRAAEMARTHRACSSLGVIENMTSEVFGSGGGERLATELGVKLLGSRAARRADPRGGRRGDAARALRPRLASRRGRSSRSPTAIDRSRGAASPARCRSSPERTAARARRRSGSRHADAAVLADHFLDAEARGPRRATGSCGVEWLEAWPDLDPRRAPLRVVAEPGYERWDGNGALGYLVLNAVVEAQLADPPASARLVVAGRTFPTGMLGYWTRRLAEGGLVAALTATSPRRLGHPDGGPKLAGTNPLSIAIPSSDGRPVVADVSMGNLTYGDVLAGRATEDDLAPFGGEHAHKAFALAVGLQLLVDALTPGRRLRRACSSSRGREQTRFRRSASSPTGVAPSGRSLSAGSASSPTAVAVKP